MKGKSFVHGKQSESYNIHTRGLFLFCAYYGVHNDLKGVYRALEFLQLYIDSHIFAIMIDLGQKIKHDNYIDFHDQFIPQI